MSKLKVLLELLSDKTLEDNYPNFKFPDLHYDNVDSYFNNVGSNVTDLLTAKSCQRCGQHEKMHGLRYCRQCYDKLRYDKNKVLRSPSNVSEAKYRDFGKGEYIGVTAEESPFKLGSNINLDGKDYIIQQVANMDEYPNIKKRVNMDYQLTLQKANSLYQVYISSDGKKFSHLNNVTKLVG